MVPILWVRRLRLRECDLNRSLHKSMIFFGTVYNNIFVLNSEAESHLARSQAPVKAFLYTLNLGYFKR